MLTLTYGYKKPQTNDKGPVVFPALEGNIQQLNDHDHDGANSKKLTAASVEAEPQTILAASWVAIADGQYRQLVTTLAGYDFDKVTINFRTPNGDYIYPTVERVTAFSFYVYTNDNTIAYTAIYGG